MRKLAKYFVYGVVTVVVLLCVAITFTIGWRPFIGPRMRPVTNRTFERTPERLSRGEYLVKNVNGCLFCHSPHDWTKRDMPIPDGMVGAGERMPMTDLPGEIYASNITPDPETGIGNWTDDEVGRAIREGVDRTGRTLFPLMPYEHYRHLSDEDLASIIVYIRSLKPVHNSVPVSKIIFPVKYLIRGVPEPVTAPVPPADLSTPLKRGTYLADIAGCSDCHTPQIRGALIAGMDFAGGFILEGPWGHVASANLTPDPSGIPYYDEALFIQAIRTCAVKARILNRIMPCDVYGGMTDQDLAAIFAYLRTLKPVRHRVDNSEPPTYCPLDQNMHGAGNQNRATSR